MGSKNTELIVRFLLLWKFCKIMKSGKENNTTQYT